MNDYTFVGPTLSRPDSLMSQGGVSTLSRSLRPFGYLLLSVVWLALVGVGFFVWLALPFGLASNGPLHLAPGITKLNGNVSETVTACFAMLLSATVIGFVLMLATIAPICMFLLSLVYFKRSLTAEFANERLSTTFWTAEAVGPVRLGGSALGMVPANSGIFAQYRPMMGKAAISLIPIRRSRLTKLLSTGMFFSLIPSWWSALSSFPLGVTYLLTVGWMLWPVTSPVAVTIWVIVTVIFAVLSVLLIVRGVRAQAQGWVRQATIHPDMISSAE